MFSPSTLKFGCFPVMSVSDVWGSGRVDCFLEVLCLFGFWSPILLRFFENSARLLWYDQAQRVFTE